MGRSGLLKWVMSSVSNLVDPERETRLEHWTARLHRVLVTQRREFDFENACVKLNVEPSERDEVALRLFERCLLKAWSDNELTETEVRSLEWLGDRVGLDENERRAVFTRACEAAFQKIFADALIDGNIDDAEWQSLERAAGHLHCSATQLVGRLLESEGEAFVRNTFVRAIEKGTLSEEAWSSILLNAKRFGYSRQELIQIIRVPAVRHIEHVLADAKMDGDISPDEEKLLEWLLRNLVYDVAFEEYARGVVYETKRFADIGRGRLPTVNPPAAFQLRAGEVPHFFGAVQLRRSRQLKSGPRHEKYDGTAVITSDRFIFSSEELAFEIKHRSVLQADVGNRELILKCSGKGDGSYSFYDHRLGSAIWLTAVGRANQTIVEKNADIQSRHIPRDVRQRVWQRYGGRCAECNSDQYLEFDHIVPHAKGGSNSDNNVQLLCRACNLAKRDHI